MKKYFLSLFILIVALISVLSFQGLARAQSSNNQDQQLQDLQNQINDAQKKLDEARGQEKTLKSQLDFIDSQTHLTELKIQQTEFQIAKLQSEIKDLDVRITRLTASVDNLSKVLLERIVKTYKYSNVSTLDLLFSSQGFSDMLERLKYLQVVQAHDKKVLYELQATKTSYNDQRQSRQTRQDEQEKLNKDLTAYSFQLDQQKAAKANLLQVTQNNEALYEQKLAAAIAEQQAILALESGGGKEVADGQVKKGDYIGSMVPGRSACSSGTHVHFEVHQNNNLVNPAGFLANHDVTWDNSPDGSFSFSGSWDLWPVNDPVSIEQGFGSTWWAQHGWYTNPPGHTGIDIWSSSSTSVRAVQDGQLSHGGIACGGGTLFYKKVDQGNGISVYYLHIT